MSTNYPTKKQPLEDWHPADIVAALRKAGWSLSRLSLHHGYKSRNTLKNALATRWPKGQRLIADAIGVPPETIWPSRYVAVTGKSSKGRSVGPVKGREVA